MNLVEQWEKECGHRLESLGYIEDYHTRLTTAVLLENQRLFNEASGKGDFLCEEIEKIIPNLLAFQIVSMQPMLGPTMIPYFDGETLFEIFSRTRMLKIKYDGNFVDEVVSDFNREITQDLHNNVGIVGNGIDDLSKIEQHIEQKIGKHPNWVVVNSEVYDEFIESDKRFDKYKVFVCDDYAQKSILVGWKGEGFSESGYLFCPYVFLVKIDAISTDEFSAMTKFTTRYGKRLVPKGSQFYGRIELQ